MYLMYLIYHIPHIPHGPQGMDRAQSVGYIIPSTTALVFLDHIYRLGTYSGVQAARG
mgnify:CR=1 FL=1